MRGERGDASIVGRSQAARGFFEREPLRDADAARSPLRRDLRALELPDGAVVWIDPDLSAYAIEMDVKLVRTRRSRRAPLPRARTVATLVCLLGRR
jgi:hypothetical protein